MIAFSQRFRQSNITAHDLIRAGRIGRILMVQERALLPNGLSAYPKWQQQPENLGVLFGYGIHNIDRLRWFLQDEAECVTAQVLRSTGGIETSTMATIRWRNGALANLWGSVDLPAPGFDASTFRSLIVGEKGLLDVDGYGRGPARRQRRANGKPCLSSPRSTGGAAECSLMPAWAHSTHKTRHSLTQSSGTSILQSPAQMASRQWQ